MGVFGMYEMNFVTIEHLLNAKTGFWNSNKRVNSVNDGCYIRLQKIPKILHSSPHISIAMS